MAGGGRGGESILTFSIVKHLNISQYISVWWCRLYYCCLIYNIYINYRHDRAVPSCDHLLELDLRALFCQDPGPLVMFASQPWQLLI